MGKLILSLIAVICFLDVGFNAVMSLDRQTEVAKRSVNEVIDAAHPASNAVSELALLPLPDDTDLIFADAEVSSDRPEPVRAVAAVRRRKPGSIRRTVTPAFVPVTHVITIPPPESFAFKTGPRTEFPRQTPDKIEAARRDEIYNQATAANIQRSEKGSLVASTIKKPWDWIKAIGAKLK